MDMQKGVLIVNAIRIADELHCRKIFLFVGHADDLLKICSLRDGIDTRMVLVVPKDTCAEGDPPGDGSIDVIAGWAGNQSRFSRIKYAFLQGVLKGIIDTDSRIVCVLGPWGKSHLDTITVHDLGRSWSEEFPFDPRELSSNIGFAVIMAVIDVALDIGALGREGKSVGTTFVVGDSENVLEHSHQAVYNPFKGYPPEERAINRSEVVESMKELAKLDGAFVISADGVVEAAGRHLDARSVLTEQMKGFGSRHRAAAGITAMTSSVSVVVSESTGRVTLFEHGKIVVTLEPVISRRLE